MDLGISNAASNVQDHVKRQQRIVKVNRQNLYAKFELLTKGFLLD
jgi:hypothetical protein